MGETQIVDGLDPEYKKRFMHHYNFPQYSVGETGRYGAPGRREIGHGALGERALEQVLPSLEEFPYAIRLVAEVLESKRFFLPSLYLCGYFGSDGRWCAD